MVAGGPPRLCAPLRLQPIGRPFHSITSVQVSVRCSCVRRSFTVALCAHLAATAGPASLRRQSTPTSPTQAAGRAPPTRSTAALPQGGRPRSPLTASTYRASNCWRQSLACRVCDSLGEVPQPPLPPLRGGHEGLRGPSRRQMSQQWCRTGCEALFAPQPGRIPGAAPTACCGSSVPPCAGGSALVRAGVCVCGSPVV